MPTELTIPYLVVGAGPVGLTAARLLANAGRPCVVVERRDGPQRHPAAHVVNARTLEIFRQAGFDMAAIGDIAQPPAQAGHVNFVTRLAGELIGRLPFERQGDECLALTPTPLRNISQHRLEPLLSADVAGKPLVDLRYSTEWVSGTQHDDGVTSLVRDVATGAETLITSSCVLGADGAASAVRRWLGVEMVGPSGLQSFVNIHFSADLRHVIADRPGILHFVLDPEVAGTFVAHDTDHEWVFMVPFDPRTESIDDYGTDRCAQLVRAAIGNDSPRSVEIIGAGTWHMTAQVAQAMRRDRVFLMGDAAHRFPPTGGMGLNTGVADAHNLVWKLLAVEDGWAAPSLLDTYETERRPVAEINCHQSLTNAFKMTLLAEALGLHRGATSTDLAAALADSTRRDSIDTAVEAQATHFDMLGLHLGYAYGHSGGVGSTAAHDIDPRDFTPTGAVGARLPHGWLADSRSTLDLIAGDALTLLTCGSHDEWAEAVAHAAIPMRHVVLDGPTTVDDGWLETCGLGTGGALLVRPDQHIEWTASTLPSDPAQDLDEALVRLRT